MKKARRKFVFLRFVLLVSTQRTASQIKINTMLFIQWNNIIIIKRIILALFIFSYSNNFDFTKSSPLDLLDYLCQNSNENFFVVNSDSVPSNWLTIDAIPYLIDRIESERITTPVFSINAGVDLKYKIRTTEGVEALFMIESFRKNEKYPSDLSSSNCGDFKNGVFYPKKALVVEIKSWYRNLNNK